MSHTISFRRPELHHVLSKITVPPGLDVVAQVRRLQDLGYQIVDVTPPLEGFGPGYNVLEVSPAYQGGVDIPKPREPKLNLVRAAFAFLEKADH